MNSPDLATERELIADGCRILACRGLADGFLGHISLRIDEDRLLVRCRGPRERGLKYTTAQDIRCVTLDGHEAAPGELDGWSVPNELPLHTEVLRRRPEVASVVHAHPPRVVTADLAGIRILPLVGAFDIPGAHLAAGGIPVHPRGVLVRNRTLATEMVDSMADRPVVVLRGHGITSAATTVQQAVLQAISVDVLAGISLGVARAGGTPVALPPEDLAELPDLGPGFNTGVAWHHELARMNDWVSASSLNQ